jgi:membrane-associated phospholipid phosphatase
MKAGLMLGAWSLLAAGHLAAQSDSTRSWTIDERLAQAVRRPAWVRTGVGHDAAKLVSFVGGSAPFVVAVGTWVWGGRTDSHDRLAMGRTTTQAILASSLVTGAFKFTLGRARPYVTGDSNSTDFKFNRGWPNDDYRSMPSGHSTMAFAFAAAMSQERARIKGRSGSFDAAMYGGASLVAFSRMMLDKHWASDIVVGSLIGTASGLLTVRLAH